MVTTLWIGIGLCIYSFWITSTRGKPTPNSQGEYLLLEHEPEDNPEFFYGSLHTLDRLGEWAAKEEPTAEALSKRLELLQVEEGLIESYLQSYKESTEKAMEGLFDTTINTPEGRGKVVGSSAVLAHRMTDRYTNIIFKLQELLSSAFYIKNQQQLNDTLELKLFQKLQNYSEKVVDNVPPRPKFMDKYMSTLAFLHLHEVYGFNPDDMRLGLDFDSKFGGSLNAKQCAEIGALALSRFYYYMAIEWLELAKFLLSPVEKDNTILVDLVSSILNVAIKEHNIAIETNWRNLERAADYYVHPTYEGEPKTTRIRMRQYIYNSPTLRKHPLAEPAIAYWDLCSGVTFQNPESQKNLKCFYESKRHPYLHIYPLKTEILSQNPPLVQFYDVLSNDSIEKIKSVAVPRLELSEVMGTDEMEEMTLSRTSAGTFMLYQEMPKLYEHTEIISGLKLILASEMAQVVEYTYGRFYSYHSDTLEGVDETQEGIDKFGDRAATMLYYLETATMGGDTPFCSAGVNARPIRGSAILWYNLYRNGTVRKDVIHGACPVIHGHKIIINHWIRYNPNWNTFKCSLNQFE